MSKGRINSVYSQRLLIVKRPSASPRPSTKKLDVVVKAYTLWYINKDTVNRFQSPAMFYGRITYLYTKKPALHDFVRALLQGPWPLKALCCHQWYKDIYSNSIQSKFKPIHCATVLMVILLQVQSKCNGSHIKIKLHLNKEKSSILSLTVSVLSENF